MNFRQHVEKLILYINTLRYLKWEQIVYRVLYFLKRISFPVACRGAPRQAFDAPAPGEDHFSFLPAAPCDRQVAFTFLNRSMIFPDGPDWAFAAYGKLWTYNLNYFDYLNRPDMSAEAGMELIRSFIAAMEKNRAGMEPYPLSLRGMNWIRFLTRHGIRDEATDQGLYRQYRHLLRNLEYHLLGNHLLENGFSLLFGGVFNAHIMGAILNAIKTGSDSYYYYQYYYYYGEDGEKQKNARRKKRSKGQYS